MRSPGTVSFALLACACAAVFVRAEAAGGQYHWTLTRDVEPEDKYYLGHPVSHYEVSLERLEVFSCAQEAQQFEAEQCQEIESAGLGFEVIRDLNGDGEMDRAVVGVARKSGGEKIGVLLIFNSLGERNPYVLTSSFSRFSVLGSNEQGLTWIPCLACDSIYPVRWHDDSGQYEIAIPEAFGDVGE